MTKQPLSTNDPAMFAAPVPRGEAFGMELAQTPVFRYLQRDNEFGAGGVAGMYLGPSMAMLAKTVAYDIADMLNQADEEARNRLKSLLIGEEEDDAEPQEVRYNLTAVTLVEAEDFAFDTEYDLTLRFTEAQDALSLYAEVGHRAMRTLLSLVRLGGRRVLDATVDVQPLGSFPDRWNDQASTAHVTKSDDQPLEVTVGCLDISWLGDGTGSLVQNVFQVSGSLPDDQTLVLHIAFNSGYASEDEFEPEHGWRIRQPEW